MIKEKVEIVGYWDGKNKWKSQKLLRLIFWDSFLDKKRVDLHTQAFHFFGKNYCFMVRFDICDLVIICREVHVHNTEI